MTSKTCFVAGCNRRHFARGWCRAHYCRWWLTGDVRASEPIKQRSNSGLTCRVLGCGRPHVALGYCSTHYGRLHESGLVRETTPIKTEEHHKMRRSAEYGIWAGIKSKCYNPNFKGYRDHGAKGITMYEPWRKSFEVFLADVGNRPGSGYFLYRIDNHKGFEPGNVRWEVMKTKPSPLRGRKLAEEHKQKISEGYRSSAYYISRKP